MSTIDSMAQMYMSEYNLTNSSKVSSSSSLSSVGSALSGITSQSSTTASDLSSTDILSQAEQAVATNNSNSQQQTNQNSALVQFYNYANSLSQATTQLSPDLNSYGISSSLSAGTSSDSISAQAYSWSNSADYDVSVSSLASAQKNSGNKLTSTAKTGLAAGTYSFNIQSGSKNTSVSFEANSGDSNQDVLNSMASAINSAKTGVTASVSTNSSSGTSQLNITANNTGTDSAFSITDVTGNAADYTGANSLTSAASNAQYSVDGNFNSSQSNTTDIDDSNASLTFSGTVSDAEVAVGSSNNVSADSVNNFVTAYNNLVSFADSNSQYISSDALNELKQGVQNQAGDLQSVGITQNSDGTLGVNQDTLSNSIANNSGAVESAMTGAGGLASNTFSATQNIVNNSLSNYASQLTTSNSESSTFYNFIGAENTSNLWSALGQNLTTTA